jgi:hypothetical protein
MSVLTDRLIVRMGGSGRPGELSTQPRPRFGFRAAVLPRPSQREVAQEDDLNQVVALDLRKRGLTDLGPIDKCRGLKVLDLSFNQLKGVKG